MKLDQLFSLHLHFRELRLLAGVLHEAGEFSRCVLLSSAAEKWEPDALLISTGIQLPKDEAFLCGLLQSDALSAAAGLLVAADERYDPAPLRAAAPAGSPPILALPLSTNTNEALDLVQAALHGPAGYANYLHAAFVRQAAPLLSGGRCPSTLLSLLYEYLQAPVFLFSSHYDLPKRCFEGESAAEAHAVWSLPREPSDRPCRVTHGDRLYLFFPVTNSEYAIAELCAVYPADRPPLETDLLLLQTVLPQISFLMLRNSMHTPFFYKRELSFFHAILTDKFHGDAEQMIRNAEHLGIPYARPRILLLLEPQPANAFCDQSCVNRISGYLSSLRQHFNLFRHDGRLVLVMECVTPQKALAEFRSAILPQLERMTKSTSMPSLGIGCSAGFSTLMELPQALSEAEFSLRMGRKTTPGKMLYVYEDYMLYHLLSCIKQTPAISLIYSEVITALTDYDQQNNTDLLETLLNLCQNNFNTIQTANQMYLHRNSLYKRFSRISEILDMDLDLPDNLITLHLAAKLYELLNRKETP